MVNINEDYVAAGIRQQIESLKALNQELEKKDLATDALQWRIRAVELQLRRLRENAMNGAVFVGS